MKHHNQISILPSNSLPELFPHLSSSHLTNRTANNALGSRDTEVKRRKSKLISTSVTHGTEKPWSEQEELKMLIAHQKYKNNWSNVAREIHGRTNNSIKNRFYSIFRKIKNKIKRRDLVYNSKLEVIETMYMITLMEEYFATPLPSSGITGKRGKDFLYTLLKGLPLDDVKDYKRNIKINWNNEITLKRLWQELYSSSTKSSEMTSKLIEVIPYTTNPHSKGKQCYILPLLPETSIPTLLTSDEKAFIKLQVFREKDIFPAENFLPYSSSTLLSTGFSSESAYFDCFSGVAAKACSKYTKTNIISSDTLFNQTSGQAFKPV